LYAFYNYTHAVQTTDNIEIPHEMSSPHRFMVKGLYRPGSKLTLGADFSISSGRVYSQAPNSSENLSVFYSQEFYQEYLRELNSQRFPTNFSLDLHLGLDLGRSDIFLNVANVTDHANAIVNSADGFIYDAGILPSIGYRLEF